jgi:hypothetical protein
MGNPGQRLLNTNAQLAKRVGTRTRYPNAQARVLVSGHNRIFGIMVSEIANPLFPEIMQVFETIVVLHGYDRKQLKSRGAANVGKFPAMPGKNQLYDLRHCSISMFHFQLEEA